MVCCREPLVLYSMSLERLSLKQFSDLLSSRLHCYKS